MNIPFIYQKWCNQNDVTCFWQALFKIQSDQSVANPLCKCSNAPKMLHNSSWWQKPCCCQTSGRCWIQEETSKVKKVPLPLLTNTRCKKTFQGQNHAGWTKSVQTGTQLPKTVDLRLNLRRCSDLTLRVNLLHLRAFLTISASCWFLLQILNYIFIQITIQPKSDIMVLSWLWIWKLSKSVPP